jgi:hypothetical protein
MSDFESLAVQLVDDAQAAASKDGIKQLKAENKLVGDACERISEESRQGNISKSELNALADTLADELDRYTKTDLKGEFSTHFSNGNDGNPFDAIIEERLESVQAVHSTDAKQGTVWRWEFSDGVVLETEASKDGGRLHHHWEQFRNDYFDALVALGKGETLGDPRDDRSDYEEWQQWINQQILNHADPVQHVGPRTEAVRMLRDYIERNVAYCDLSIMRERNGIWVDNTKTEDVTEIRVPLEEIKRICDELSVTTRALQIELDARGLTHDETSGVSGAGYVSGVRVPYWVLTPSIADPKEIIADPSTPAEKAAERASKQHDDDRTTVGNTGSDDTDGNDNSGTITAPETTDTEDSEEEYTPGMTDSFGTDPDADEEASDD